jgi:hypothetical protein
VFDADMIAYARTLRERGVAVPEIAAKLVNPHRQEQGQQPLRGSVYRALADTDATPTQDDGPSSSTRH